MALTGQDETDLLLPLFASNRHSALFETFLERLRRRTRAVSCSLTVRTSDTHEVQVFASGVDVVAKAKALGLEDFLREMRIQNDGLKPGRTYSRDELDAHAPLIRAKRLADMRQLGLVDERIVRLLDDEAQSAWLAIASDRACTAADAALLSNLVPYVAAALQSVLANQRQALDAAFNPQLLDRAGVGWMAFDAGGRLLALAPTTRLWLENAIGQPARLGQPLRGLGTEIEHKLSTAAARLARSVEAGNLAADGLMDAIVLTSSPRIEAVLRPAPDIPSLHVQPAMIAWCRQSRSALQERITAFAAIHGLPRREAELAIRLASGLSMAEAAQSMRLTLETTRNYSKRLYNQLSIRGQAELVRTVHESGAMLA